MDPASGTAFKKAHGFRDFLFLRTIDQIIRDWIARDLFMHSSGALWMRRTELLDHWVWLKPFLQMQKDIEQSVAVPDTMVMPDVER